MPKAKAKRKIPAPATDPDGCHVGLPDVPPLYGLKPRKKYLPLQPRRKKASRVSQLLDLHGAPRRPSSLGFRFGASGSTALCSSALQAPRARLAIWHTIQPSPCILDSGDDVVILEGAAVKVDLSDRLTFKKLDAASRSKYKMPLMVVPESVVYSVRPRVVLAWTEKDFPNNATRWTFDSAAV